MASPMAGGETVRNYCEKKRTLVTMTVVMSSVSFAMLCTGVLTDYWLHSREQVGEPTGNATPIYRIAHAGLWRKCYTLEESSDEYTCETITYFGDGDDEQTDLTQQIALSIRRATVFPLICIALLLAGSVVCFIGHCNYRHKYLTFIAGILFVFSGLFNLIGIVLYIGSVTQEVGNRKPKEMEENPRFVYNYGISFVLTVSSFVLSEFTGVTCIYLYISRHKSALRKVQTRALLQRSHSEAELGAMRRRRLQPNANAPASDSKALRRVSTTDGNMLAPTAPRHPQEEISEIPGDPAVRKPVFSLGDLAPGGPAVGTNAPLMSVSVPRWCEPPPVRYVPAGTPSRASSRPASQFVEPISQAPQDSAAKLWQLNQPPPGYLPEGEMPQPSARNPEPVGYTASENPKDNINNDNVMQHRDGSRKQRRQHRRSGRSGHRSKSRDRQPATAQDGDDPYTVNDPLLAGGPDDMHPQELATSRPVVATGSSNQPNASSLSSNSRASTSASTVHYGGRPGTLSAAYHPNQVTADFSLAMLQAMPQQRPQQQQQYLPPPSAGLGVHPATAKRLLWNFPPPPTSPTDFTTTNDDLSSTSAVDRFERPPSAYSSKLKMANVPPDRSAARNAHKVKHKQKQNRPLSSQLYFQYPDNRLISGGTRGQAYSGDSSGDQLASAGEMQALYGGHHPRYQTKQTGGRRVQSELVEDSAVPAVGRVLSRVPDDIISVKPSGADQGTAPSSAQTMRTRQDTAV